MNINKLAVVYVRVSTQYQIDNFSVQGQRELTYLAARYGFARVEIREEQGVSAETITVRPVMKVILEEIAKGIIGALIVASFTRLTRDMDDIDGRIIRNLNMRTKRFPHLFSGIMRCPHCGDVMAGYALTQGVKKKKTRFSYNC